MTHYIKNRVHYLRQRLRERDGDRCWLCGRLMVFDSRKNKPDAATLDHVIPREHGGPTTMANLKLAHKLCNNRRGSPAPPRLRREGAG